MQFRYCIRGNRFTQEPEFRSLMHQFDLRLLVEIQFKMYYKLSECVTLCNSEEKTTFVFSSMNWFYGNLIRDLIAFSLYKITLSGKSLKRLLVDKKLGFCQWSRLSFQPAFLSEAFKWLNLNIEDHNHWHNFTTDPCLLQLYHTEVPAVKKCIRVWLILFTVKLSSLISLKIFKNSH